MLAGEYEYFFLYIAVHRMHFFRERGQFMEYFVVNSAWKCMTGVYFHIKRTFFSMAQDKLGNAGYVSYIKWELDCGVSGLRLVQL